MGLFTWETTVKYCSALGVWRTGFQKGLVSDGDWAPNDQIGRLNG